MQLPHFPYGFQSKNGLRLISLPFRTDSGLLLSLLSGSGAPQASAWTARLLRWKKMTCPLLPFIVFVDVPVFYFNAVFGPGSQVGAKSSGNRHGAVLASGAANCHHQPYGDVGHLLRPLAYQKHPYQWPTIGKDLSHVANATLEEVKAFFFRFYAPNNAILAVTGNISFEEAVELTEKWFGSVPRREVPVRNLPQEPEQTEERRLTVERNVPLDSLFMAYHMCDHRHPDYYVFDILSDVLSNGRSSRLNQHLVQEKQLFSSIDAYISGSVDAGLFHIAGKPSAGVSLELAEAAVRDELDRLQQELVDGQELEKVKNKFESTQIFGNINYLNVATNLAWFELLGKAEDLEKEVERYRSVTAMQLREVAQSAFRKENGVVLYYKSK